MLPASRFPGASLPDASHGVQRGGDVERRAAAPYDSAMQRTDAPGRHRPAPIRIAGRRGLAAIFAACYGLTLAIHWAHRDDWLRLHTFAVALPGALLIFALAGIVPLLLFALLRFRRGLAAPLGALWLIAAILLTLAAATAPI
jgi:hypothetical protein